VDLQNSFSAAKSSKFSTKPILGYPSHLIYVAALPCTLENLIIINLQFSCVWKHIWNVTFYHLSNRCLPTVMKINVKINTMQNTNILLFVRSLSSTYWRNAWLQYGPIYDRTLLTPQLTSEESVSRHCVRANGWHVEHLCEQTLADNLHFHVFLVQVASITRVSILLCWCLMVDRSTMLNCKALSLLRTVNEQNVKCWYFAWC